uniref:Uncharacterized protein n=1 Tax=Anguilla anguilla TaxID=7936 RepID=A0A0E9UCA8_ANGAN
MCIPSHVPANLTGAQHTYPLIEERDEAVAFGLAGRHVLHNACIAVEKQAAFRERLTHTERSTGIST